MKKLIFILIVGSMFAEESSPCEDETYLQLKKKKLDEMSDREYQYFTTKETACEQWKINQQDLSKMVVVAEAETKKMEIKNENVSNIAWAIVTAIIMIGIFFG